MAMEEALIARLSAVAGLSGISVAWFERPRSFPAVTLSKVTPGRDYTQDGPDGLDIPVVQFDCWSLDSEQVVAMARALRAEMEITTDKTVSGWLFHVGFLTFENWSTEDLDGGKTVFRAQQDYNFAHEQG
jgi:hypothetical protein